MINWIQKTFHTDKWWGKAIFMLLTYTIYWCVFYGSLSLISEDAFVGNDYAGIILISYVFIFVPVVSFLLMNSIKKFINIRHPYLLNIVFLILSLVLFFYIDLIKSMPHWLS
ncbi:MAG: hypothetical protein NTW62_02665 [Candidatus Nomurabacteria bacterium]|nr:hypothetical protein [Candidatus Nomurabacteria bacterium]